MQSGAVGIAIGAQGVGGGEEEEEGQERTEGSPPPHPPGGLRLWSSGPTVGGGCRSRGVPSASLLSVDPGVELNEVGSSLRLSSSSPRERTFDPAFGISSLGHGHAYKESGFQPCAAFSPRLLDLRVLSCFSATRMKFRRTHMCSGGHLPEPFTPAVRARPPVFNTPGHPLDPPPPCISAGLGLLIPGSQKARSSHGLLSQTRTPDLQP